MSEVVADELSAVVYSRWVHRPSRFTTPIPERNLPSLLRRRSSDEYQLPCISDLERAVRSRCAATAVEAAKHLGIPLDRYLASGAGTAAGLQTINWAAGAEYFEVPATARLDQDEARSALGGGEFVVDVQCHYVAFDRFESTGANGILQFIRGVAPDRFRELDGATSLRLAEFLRCVFVESETSVALLTAAPGVGEHNILDNAEIAGTRELVDRLADTGRLLHHAIVHPNIAGELDTLDEVVSRHRPSGFKVYTLFGAAAERSADRAGVGWMLDDDTSGIPFLEKARALGVRIICAHKGLGGLAPTSSPRDIGPAAATFPDLNFVVYHSGYEPGNGGEEEGRFSEQTAHLGTNRLVESLRSAGIEPGANVYAELGSTWFLLMNRPREAAHVLGKLLDAVGEDNILWGTDSPWYGPCQPLIDAFRAFQIPESMQEEFGYRALSSQAKVKILGGNACRLYGIDADRVRRRAANDDLSWVREAVNEAQRRGSVALR